MTLKSISFVFLAKLLAAFAIEGRSHCLSYMNGVTRNHHEMSENGRGSSWLMVWYPNPTASRCLPQIAWDTCLNLIWIRFPKLAFGRQAKWRKRWIKVDWSPELLFLSSWSDVKCPIYRFILGRASCSSFFGINYETKSCNRSFPICGLHNLCKYPSENWRELSVRIQFQCCEGSMSEKITIFIIDDDKKYQCCTAVVWAARFKLPQN